MDFINKIIKKYEKETNKTLSDNQKEDIKQVILKLGKIKLK